MSSNQRKQLMARGLPQRPRNFRRLPHFQRHRRKLGPSPAHPKARKLLRLQAHQSSEIGAVNSPRSAAKRPINSSSSSAPEGQRQRILTSTARERLLASGRRNPTSSSSRSLLRARSTRVGAVLTALSRLRERVTIWRCSGLAVSKLTRSSLTARSQKSSIECVA
jgi:hypothetical protein